MFKRTFLRDLKGQFCGSSTIQHKENMTIHKNGCSEVISYHYETKKPPKTTSKIPVIFL